MVLSVLDGGVADDRFRPMTAQAIAAYLEQPVSSVEEILGWLLDEGAVAARPTDP